MVAAVSERVDNFDVALEGDDAWLAETVEFVVFCGIVTLLR